MQAQLTKLRQELHAKQQKTAEARMTQESLQADLDCETMRKVRFTEQKETLTSELRKTYERLEMEERLGLQMKQQLTS